MALSVPKGTKKSMNDESTKNMEQVQSEQDSPMSRTPSNFEAEVELGDTVIKNASEESETHTDGSVFTSEYSNQLARDRYVASSAKSKAEQYRKKYKSLLSGSQEGEEVRKKQEEKQQKYGEEVVFFSEQGQEPEESGEQPSGQMQETVEGAAEATRQAAQHPVANIAGGVLDATQELINAGIDTANFIETKFGIDAIPENARVDEISKLIPKSDNPIDNLMRSSVKFVTGFAAGMKGANKLVKTQSFFGNSSKALAVGAIADYAMTNPNEELLSNWVQESGLKNPVTNYLAAKEGDTNAEVRLKAALEGAGLGLMTEGVFSTLKGIKSLRKFKRAKKGFDAGKMGKDVDQALKEIDEVPPPVDEEYLKNVEDLESKKPLTIETQRMEGVDGQDVVRETPKIDLTAINTRVQLEEMVQEHSKNFAKQIDDARRGVQTHEETTKLARLLDMDAEELYQRRLGQSSNAEELMAMTDIVTAAGKDLKRIATKFKDGQATAKELTDAIEHFQAMHSEFSGATAEAGRALNIMKKAKIETDQAMLPQIENEIKEMYGEKDLAKMANRLADMQPEQVSRAVSKSKKAKLSDAIFEVYANGLLSSGVTFAKNIVSTSISTLGGLAETAIAEGLGKGRGAIANTALAKGARKIPVAGKMVPSGVGADVYAGHTRMKIMALQQSMADAMHLAGKAFKEGESYFDSFSKIETLMQPSFKADTFGIDGSTLLGQVAKPSVDAMGSVIRVPGRGLMAGDEFFKFLNYRMDLYTQAYDRAAAKGLQGEDMARDMAETISRPPKDVGMKALDFAREQTFTTPLRGNAFDFMKGLRSIPGGRFNFPFLRTNINIVRYGVERSPLINMALPSVRKSMKQGGAARDMVLAKSALGGAAMITAGNMYLSGKLTGSLPKNPEVREIWRLAGIEPNSILLDGKYISYEGLGPISQILKLTADFGRLTDYALNTADRSVEEDRKEIGLSIMVTIGNYLTPEYLIENISTISEIVQGDNLRAFEKFVAQKSASAVPFSSLQRDIREKVDPIRRDTRADATTEFPYSIFESSMNSIANTIPGLSEDLPAAKNIFGETIDYAPGIDSGIASPIYSSKKTDDPVSLELFRVGVVDQNIHAGSGPVEKQLSIGMPSRVIEDEGVQVALTDKQYNDYVMLAAGQRDSRKTLKQKLKDEMDSTKYRKATDEMKKLRLGKIIRAMRQKAEATLIKEYPSIKTEILEGVRELEKAVKGR